MATQIIIPSVYDIGNDSIWPLELNSNRRYHKILTVLRIITETINYIAICNRIFFLSTKIKKCMNLVLPMTRQ